MSWRITRVIPSFLSALFVIISQIGCATVPPSSVVPPSVVECGASRRPSARSEEPDWLASWPRTTLATNNFETCAIRNGEVWCWGSRFVAVVEGGREYARRPPMRISVPGFARSVTLGSVHSCALVDGGALYCWGANFFGALGRPPSSFFTPTPVRVRLPRPGLRLLADSEPSTMVLLDDGKVYVIGGCPEESGSCTSRYLHPDVVHQVKRVTLGGAVLHDGRVYAWGDDSTGRVTRTAWNVKNERDRKPRWAKGFVPGIEHTREYGSAWLASCALLEDQAVRCWGSNHFGVVGVPVPEEERGPDPWAARDPDYVLVDLHEPVGLGKSKQLWCGARGCCAEELDGAVKCWGYNLEGRIAPRENRAFMTPTRMPFRHPRALVIAAAHFCYEASEPGYPIYCRGMLDPFADPMTESSEPPIEFSKVPLPDQRQESPPPR